MQVPAEFFSPGKLLLTGEYFVLYGAKALAVPTVYGQHLNVSSSSDSQSLAWEFRNNSDQTLFKEKWNWSEVDALADDGANNDYVPRLLQAIKRHKINLSGKKLVFRVNYPQAWGLGSSAAMLANVAKWTQLDPMELFFESQSGSGYDVACSFQGQTIFYQLVEGRPVWEPTHFQPDFTDRLWLVYYGQKQSSAQEVKRFLQRNPPDTATINEMSALTLAIATEKQLSTFQDLLRRHEALVANAIGQRPVQEKFFSDFQGVVKSLGAWGGDFMLAVSNTNSSPELYFKEKGFPWVMNWKQIIG